MQRGIASSCPGWRLGDSACRRLLQGWYTSQPRVSIRADDAARQGCRGVLRWPVLWHGHVGKVCRGGAAASADRLVRRLSSPDDPGWQLGAGAWSRLLRVWSTGYAGLQHGAGDAAGQGCRGVLQWPVLRHGHVGKVCRGGAASTAGRLMPGVQAPHCHEWQLWPSAFSWLLCGWRPGNIDLRQWTDNDAAQCRCHLCERKFCGPRYYSEVFISSPAAATAIRATR